VEAFRIALVVFGFALVVFLLLLLRFPQDVRSLVLRVDSIEMNSRGIAVRFFQQAIREKEGTRPSRRRLRSTIEKIPPGHILWVDDAPLNNSLETQALRAAGVQVDVATYNEEAREYLARRDYDLVLSDIDRASPGGGAAGLEVPTILGELRKSYPVAFYVGRADAPEAPGGQPVFDKPTELLEHIADQLGRRSTR
jgi:CheY-like chemotaxis protein